MARNDQISRHWQLLWRLSHGPARKQELAQEFDVHPRTITRDIEILSTSFPIVDWEEGNEVVYAFQEGYKLPGVWFTPQELAILYFGRETLHNALKDTPFMEDFTSLLEKVERTQSDAKRRASQQLPEVYQSDFSPPHVDTVHFEALLKAAQERHCVEIHYFVASRGEDSTRVVEPFMLRLTHQGLHLLAYCRTRRDFRSFTINRIHSLTILDETFELEQRRFDLNAYLTESFGGLRSDPVQRIHIRIKYPTAHWARHLNFHPTQELEEIDDGVELRFRAGGEDAVIRRVIGLGPDCELLEPALLREKVLEQLETIAKNYRTQTSEM